LSFGVLMFVIIEKNKLLRCGEKQGKRGVYRLFPSPVKMDSTALPDALQHTM
jgi:hypothetical protein